MARKGEGDKRHATHSVGRDDQSDVVADHGRSGERGAGEEKGCRRWWLGMREFFSPACPLSYPYRATGLYTCSDLSRSEQGRVGQRHG